MKTLYKQAFLVVMAAFTCVSSSAYVDSEGNESTQFLFDYETMEKTYFECGTLDELWSWIDNNLSRHISYSEDETGVIVEIDIDKAVFNNMCPDGYDDLVWDGFAWDVGYEIEPSKFVAYNYEGGVSWSPEWDSYMLPSKRKYFYLDSDKNIEDVRCSVIELETKDIGNIQLIPTAFFMFDKPQRASESNEEYLPSELSFIFTDERQNNNVRFFEVMLYLGQFRQSDWSLRAVTHVKFHISNCSLYPAGIEDVADGGADVRPRYFNMQGMEVRQPEHGKMYIIREGSKSRKAIYK